MFDIKRLLFNFMLFSLSEHVENSIVTCLHLFRARYIKHFTQQDDLKQKKSIKGYKNIDKVYKELSKTRKSKI